MGNLNSRIDLAS